MEEHKYWCPDYPHYCTSERDVKNCEGETLRKYMKSVDKQYDSENDRERDDESDNDYENDDESELDDDEIRDYVRTIVQQSNAIMRGGCETDECNNQSRENDKFSKWTIPKH